MIAPDAPIMRIPVLAEWVDEGMYRREVYVPEAKACGLLIEVEQKETHHRTRLLLGRWVEVKGNDIVVWDGLSLGGAR